MITQEEAQEIVEGYDLDDITIGVLGGHSALDVCRGAKMYGFNTLAVCQRGREKTYTNYYRTREKGGCIDDTIVLDKFKDVVTVQEELRDRNTIFIHNRYFWVYCNFNEIENEFRVPIFGTRTMLKLEERDVPKNQYYLLKKAGIRMPKIFESPEDIDRLVIVKASEAIRGYERAFFYAASYEDYQEKAEELVEKGMITEEDLDDAVIEEYVVGAPVNYNYFYSVIDDELEIMGTDTRRQTNLEGILRLPATEQLEILKYVDVKLVETGHYAVTTKESIIEKIFTLGEKFVETTKKEHPPGIIGPFALQGAVAAYKGREESVIFDVSMRIPGSPGTRFTPHTGYMYGESISYGERIAIEIQNAIDQGRLEEIIT